MDFVDEQHLTLFKRREDGGEITGVLDGWPGRNFEGRAQLVRDDHRECCLPEARRPR